MDWLRLGILLNTPGYCYSNAQETAEVVLIVLKIYFLGWLSFYILLKQLSQYSQS